MKYRRLRDEELNDLEPEFRQFLVARNITSNNWTEIQTSDNVQIYKLIDEFSEQVFDKAIRKIKYLEHRSPKDIMVFECTPDAIFMIGLVVEMNGDIDFTDPNCLTALNDTPEEHLKKSLTVYKSRKPYDQKREVELFYLLESGCKLSTKSTFQSLQVLAEISS